MTECSFTYINECVHTEFCECCSVQSLILTGACGMFCVQEQYRFCHDILLEFLANPDSLALTPLT